MTEASMLDPLQTGLPLEVVEAMQGVFKRHQNIEQVVLYGSRAIGNYRDGSDIDLTIVGDLSYHDLLTIELELDDLMLPYKMDVSLKHQLDNTSLIEHINRVGKPFFVFSE